MAEGSDIWLADPDQVWVRAKVVDETANAAECELSDGERRRVAPGSGGFFLCNHALSSNGVDDMCSLDHLHEPAVLANLSLRHAAKRPYTYTGPICIAMNPYKWISESYTKQMQQAYVAQARRDLAPHVYSASAKAYSDMVGFGTHQSILVSGESGAGKTETVKILMGHLAHVSKSKVLAHDKIVPAVLKSNALMESFGNAKTSRKRTNLKLINLFERPSSAFPDLRVFTLRFSTLNSNRKR
jgi:myosin-5